MTRYYTTHYKVKNRPYPRHRGLLIFVLVLLFIIIVAACGDPTTRTINTAHTPTVTPTCTTLSASIDKGGYPKGSTITVYKDGVQNSGKLAYVLTDVGDGYTYRVVITSTDAIGALDTGTKTVAACPSSTTTVAVTTTPATTTAPTTTVVVSSTIAATTTTTKAPATTSAPPSTVGNTTTTSTTTAVQNSCDAIKAPDDHVCSTTPPETVGQKPVYDCMTDGTNPPVLHEVGTPLPNGFTLIDCSQFHYVHRHEEIKNCRSFRTDGDGYLTPDGVFQASVKVYINGVLIGNTPNVASWDMNRGDLNGYTYNVTVTSPEGGYHVSGRVAKCDIPSTV